MNETSTAERRIRRPSDRDNASTERDSNRRSETGGPLGTLGDRVSSNPAASRLLDATQSYLRAKGRNLAESVGDRFGGLGDVIRDVEDGGSPTEVLAKAGAGKVGDKVKEAGAKVKDAVTGGGKSTNGPKVINIVEDIDIGVPARTAYDQWTQFQEFNRFMKGVEGVDQKDDTTANWRVKIGPSRRTWEAKITEQIPDKRIAWISEGAKGTVSGVVTFHELTEDLTKVLLVLEYHPKGFFEHVGNLVRAQGRRARLDLKHFRRFVMTQGDATGSWRGEIRDHEVIDLRDDSSGAEEDRGEQQRGEQQRGEQQRGERQGGERQRGERQGGERQGGERERGERQRGEPSRGRRPAEGHGGDGRATTRSRGARTAEAPTRSRAHAEESGRRSQARSR